MASCKRTEQQSSTGRELEESGVANFGLADLISLLHGESLMREQTENLLRDGWTGLRFFQFPNVPSNTSLLKCSHIWEGGGGEQRIRGAAASTTSLTAQYCSLLLKGFERPSTANSAISTLLLFTLGAAGTRNKEHCSLHSWKKPGRPFLTPSHSLGKEGSLLPCAWQLPPCC